MVTTWIACWLVVAVLAWAMVRKGGLLESVSETAYVIPRWAFSIWIVAVGMLLLPGLIEHLHGGAEWVGFLLALGLLLVGGSSCYKEEMTVLHYIGGIMAVVCASFVTVVDCPWLFWGWFLYLVAMVWKPSVYWLFWAEVTVFVLMIAAMVF